MLAAFREVEDQLSTLHVLDEEAAIQANAVAASERSLTLANNRYRGGVTSYLEVITAQQAALANERAAVNILIRRMNATVLLLKGLGGGWNVFQKSASLSGERCRGTSRQGERVSSPSHVRLPGHHASDGARRPGAEAPDVRGS